MNHALITQTYEATSRLTTESSRDEVCAAIEFSDALKQATRELAAKVEAAVIDWIRTNGELTIGTRRYWVGPNRTTRCVSTKDTLEAVLFATGGNCDAVAQLLSAGAWKHGACRKILHPEAYAALFETRETTDLKTGESKGDKLQMIDERFTQ